MNSEIEARKQELLRQQMREEYAVDILQSHNPDGSVNEKFCEAYPESARARGLIDKVNEEYL